MNPAAVEADITASQNGNHDAYSRLIAHYQSPLAQRLRRFTRNSTDLEQLVHDTFVEAWFSLHTYSARAPFEHWLNRIATRVGYRYWKQRQKNSRNLPIQPVEPISPANPSAGEAADLLHSILQQLPPRDRLIITLLYLEQHSVAHAAELTGWSQTMIKVQAFRARAKLKKLLQTAGITEKNL